MYKRQLSLQISTVQFSVVAVNDPKNESQTREISLGLYRILQELINNVLKYAESTEIQIVVEQSDEGVQIVLTDNGKGFIPTKQDKLKSQSLGLKNIESRSQQIQAKIDYELLNPGTKVTITWQAT